LAAGQRLPTRGRVFLSVRDADKPGAVRLGRMLAAAGFELLATRGTHWALSQAGIAATCVAKVTEGQRPHIVDRLLAGDVQLIINTTEGTQAIRDSQSIRQAALDLGIPYYTTLAGGLAAAEAIIKGSDVTRTRSLQAYHGRRRA